jgi:hypothetical protein
VSHMPSSPWDLCRRLDVNGAGLVGAIPKSFSDLTALTYLDLGDNPDITKLTYFGNLKKLECVTVTVLCVPY